MKKLVSLVALAVACVGSAQAKGPGLVLTGQWAYIAADHKGCERQPHLSWCAKRLPATERKITQADLIAAEDFVNRHMRSKVSKRDRWASYYDVASKGQTFEGDCDNFVFTALEWMEHQGLDMKTVRRALVDTSGDGELDHMIAMVPIAGEWWVFADTSQAKPYLLADAKWRILYSSAIDSIEWDFTSVGNPTLASR